MKNFIITIILISSITFLFGCSLIMNREIPSEMTHSYTIHVVSTENADPIKGASVEVFGKKFITDSDGIVTVDISGRPVRDGRSVYFKSGGKILVTKENYVQETKEPLETKKMWRYGQGNSWNIDAYVKMIDIDTKICPDVIKSDIQDNARKLALYFYDYDKLADLGFIGACEVNYKGKKYLSFEMDSTVKFNENRMTDFDIAKKVFVYPVIGYIKLAGKEITKENSIYGLKFKINTTIEDFTRGVNVSGQDFNATGREIVLEYLIPTESIQSFIDQNISRQELVDSSFVLINDELIKISFQ